MCVDYFYSWPCGHEERLDSQECLFADEPNLHNHTRLRPDLGNPGYACLTCPQEVLLAPGFYPPLGVAPNFARIAALQGQLETVWQSIRHARHQQYLPRRRGELARTALESCSDQTANQSRNQASGEHIGRNADKRQKRWVIVIGPESDDGISRKIHPWGCMVAQKLI
ncbi:hypothetical protein MMC22_003954 [Lobaria immixta]|nr:hypothetical protein [Lobaria immixta]